MRIIKHDIDTDTDVKIVPLADLHIGDSHSDAKTIADILSYIRATKNVYCVLDGDAMNTAIMGSKSDVYGETMPPMEQLKKCVELFKPLADSGKILAILTGNHEERIRKSVGVNLTEVMSTQLGLSSLYSDTSTLLSLRLGRNAKKNDRRITYSIYVNHGNGGGGRRAGSKINAMEDMSRIITANCYIMGHTHQPAVFRKAHYVANPNGSVSLIEQVFVNTASALDWSGSYGDRAGYQPNSKRYPVITFACDRHDISVAI